MDTQTNDIVARFVALLAQAVVTLLGPQELAAILPEVKVHTGFSRFWRGIAEDRLDLTDHTTLEKKLDALISRLAHTLGVDLTESWLEDIYTKIEKAYTPALANERILPLIPERYLEKYRLRILSKEELETMLEHEQERDRELTKANTELRELDQRKSEFISVVAHQLRTPLSGLKWALSMLRKGEVGPVSAAQKKVLDQSYAGNDRMIALVEDMLGADQIAAGRYTLSRTPIDLIALITGVITQLQFAAVSKKISVSLVPPAAPLPMLSLDKEKTRLVFQNLIENAINYSRPGGMVRVSLARGEQTVEISVADDGIGIPPDEQGQIFSRLFRAKNARAVEPNGNGLGLYLVKHILELHGASIRFESTEGTGTTFFISFPLESTDGNDS